MLKTQERNQSESCAPENLIVSLNASITGGIRTENDDGDGIRISETPAEKQFLYQPSRIRPILKIHRAEMDPFHAVPFQRKPFAPSGRFGRKKSTRPQLGQCSLEGKVF